MGEEVRKEKIFIIKKVINQKKWSKEEDKELIDLVQKNNEKNWKEISSHFHKKTPLQCFSRYMRIKPGINKGFWKKEEDDLILNLIGLYGTSWSKISKIIKTRNGKQIRDRYINILAPNINKNKFSPEEDNLLINLYKQYGAKWSIIKKYFKDRTTDMIKNRYHSNLKKKYEELNNNKNIKNNYNNNIINIKKNNSEKKIVNNNNINNKEIISSTESSSSHNKDYSSTISKLSYPPSSIPIKQEKEDRKNIDNQTNNLFNNDFFGYDIDDDDEFMQ